MKRVILGTAALAAMVALAGCGGSTSASGNTVGATVGTTGGVAGAQTTKGGMSFNAQVNGMQHQLSAVLKQLRKGNVAGAANAGGTLLTTCQSTVNKKLQPRANTPARRQAVTHMQIACQDLANASQAAASGNTQQAKQLAQQALDEATTARNALNSSSG